MTLAQTAAEVLRIQDVAVRLGGTRILEGVSLSVASGELVGLVGPNGSGKTTLLRAILTEPRPHPLALSPEQAAEQLRREVRSGQEQVGNAEAASHDGVADDRALEGTFLIESGWTVEPRDGGSRIHWNTRFQARGPLALFTPVLRGAIRKGQLTDLGALKNILEAEG